MAFQEVAGSLGTLRHEEVLEKICTIMSLNSVPPIPRKYRVLPLCENLHFHGRAVELEELSNALLGKDADKLLIHSIIGLSGVGKSQLALKFVYQNLQDFEGVFWISADNDVKLAQGFATIAKEVGIIDEGSTLPLDAVREITKRWLKTNSESCLRILWYPDLIKTGCKWLLVLDNVENLDFVHPYLPTGATGRVIMTSQNRETFQNPVITSIWLQPLSAEEGVALLASMLPVNIMQRRDTLDNIEKMPVACGGLPLALSRVARNVCNYHYSMADLLQQSPTIYHKEAIINRTPLPDYFHEGKLSTLWDNTLNTLSRPARYLINLFTFFDLDAIPEDLIKTQKSVNQDLQMEIADEHV